MQAEFKYVLDKTDTEKITTFCKNADYCSVEQLIGWPDMFFRSRICYFYLSDDSGIKSFCQIHEGLRFAQIAFGPVCGDKEIMVYSLDEIIQYYKNKRYLYLGIQMYSKSGNDTDFIEYKLNKKWKIHYFFNADNTKSSVEIDLGNSVEEIFSRFSKGHKSDIKKASKMGLTVSVISNLNELNLFVEVYSKMCKNRNITDDLSNDIIYAIHRYLLDNERGYILVAKDNTGKIIGGGIFVFQGLTVRYFKGTTDPDRRDVPILHAVIFEAIKLAKSKNFKYFDFWGYNHFADESDQIFKINQFKRGFGGDYIFLAKKMNIDLLFLGYYYFRAITFVKVIISHIRYTNN